MFIDNILNQILKPFRDLYSKWMTIRGIKGGIQGDIRRVQQLGGQAQGYGNMVQGYGQQAVRVAGGAQPGQQPPQQQMPAAVPPPTSKTPGKTWMSWFPWSKKTCPGCQQKLHKSWDQCPYCGMAQGGAAPPQQPMQQNAQQGMAGQQQGMPGQQQQGYGQNAPYGGGPGPQGYPAPGMAQRTIAMDAAAIAAPLISTRDQGENVGWLVPLEGAQTGELLQFNGRVVVGTVEGCDFKFFDASISSRHAELNVDPQGRFRITDLGSTNGTYVNDKKIASIELVDGDNIRLGRTTFRFKTKS